jgi:WD40 repeat protein/serine/threonine protein kinase
MASDPKHVQAVFLAAVELPAAERAAVLDRECGNDAELRQRVKALLQAHEQPGSFLESPAANLFATADDSLAEHSGTAIGPYKLLEQIGEGGFGIVFMAEQQQPVRRKVALKVVKPGMDSKQIIARFEAERQALAMMNHQNIAHVLDAGTTDSGRPYFVMELVRGIPITQFCDDNRLTLPERLELFVAVCQAVQHAHQKGIIHRDLKPSNVLVTSQDGSPLVKVIDFGIAKALGQERLTDKTLFTGFAQMIGTPLYMSPEQAERSGQDADTRSDIYSLGALLYELLTGTTPFDKERLKEADYDEIRRIIREEEPAKPSTRISTLGQAGTTVSANRQSEPKRLSHLFRGELDWIVMKALEKDRNRRYDTASSFAADVQHYLHDEPVQACPPSAWYRFRKFSRRNKRALTMASAITITVFLAVAASSGLMWRANRELRQNLYYQAIALAEREWSANNLGRMLSLLDECPEDLRGWEWHYLKRLRVASLSVLLHPSAVLSVAFSPNGRWIAAGGQDGVVKVWDAATGREVHSFRAHQHNVWGLAFSPDGRRVGTASDGSVKVWDAETGQERFTLSNEPKAQAWSVAFSPDGRWVAAGIGFGDHRVPGEVKVWDAITGQAFLSLGGHSSGVNAVAFSPDGQRLASASTAGTVILWDVQTGRQILTFRAHRYRIDRVEFSPDGKQLASAPSDYRTKAEADVKVWDAQTGREILTLRGHVGFVISVTFTPDGRRLASADGDGTVKLWDLTTGQEALTLRGHHGYVRGVAFSPDGHRLVSAGIDGTVRIWDATPLAGEAGQEFLTLRGHEGGVRSVAFQPGGRYLASAGNDETVRLWDLQLGRMGGGNPLIHTLPGNIGFVMTVNFSSDGRLLASAGLEHSLRVWDATTWKELYADVKDKGRHVGAFSPDGRYLTAVGGEFSLVILDARSGHSIRTLRGHKSYIRAVAFSPDSRRLASGSADGTVRIWDVAMGKAIVDPPLRHRGFVSTAAFNPDGRLLASAGDDRIVKVWDTTTWKEVQTLRDPTGGVFSLAFHKDGRLVAWGGTDSTIKIGDVKTGEVLHTLRGHTSWVESVAFSPDGEWIASASLDGTVKLWKAPALPEATGRTAE